ncbi:thiamine ABC transporter substrate-binding protein [Escherichia coli]
MAITPRKLAETGEENRHRHQRLERSLRPVFKRRKRSGTELHHLSGLSHSRRKKDNYAAANFSEGHYLQVEVAARTAASKQPELAQKFLQFMVSPAFQNAIPTGNWMYPVANVTLPAGFEQLTKPATTLEFTPAEVAAQRQAWISEWQRAVSR